MNIIGKSECTASQMAQYLISKNPNAKSWALEYAQLYLEEGDVEGVRGDGAWIQSCKETGNFMFIGGTAVTFDQNNFCGLGVTSKGMKGHSFNTPRLGIRAQIQHLKGYATSAPLKNACIDPRYKYISPKGKAPTFEELAGKWAVPGYDTSKASSLEDAMNKKIGYGFDIVKGVEVMKKIATTSLESSDISNSLSGLYRVQCGAYSVEASANTLATRLKNVGFSAIVKKINNLYKVQIGAFSKKENATELMNKVKAKGFTATIVYDSNNSESKTETIEKENATIMGKYKVAVDAGHGSQTAGKRTVDGYREHWINVKCANYFDIAMKRCGIETVKIAWDDTDATDDTDVALSTRQSQIKNAKCDISISWHANAHGSGTAWTTGQGIETLIHNNASRVGDSRKLADKVQSQLIKGTTQKNRGVKSQSLAMCNCTAMGTKASILIEVGFMTNEYEAQLLKTDAFCLECAEEAAKGVCEYLGVTYKVNNTSIAETPTQSSPNTSTPIPSQKTTVTYTTHRIPTNSWGSEITGYNLINSMGYSGSFGNEIDKFTAKLSEGKITYTVHRDGKWGGEINGYSKTDTNNYAGSSNKPIDAIAIKAEGINGTLKYRVHRKTDNKWGGWITGYSKTDTNNYAGSFGKPIDAIQIGIE